MSEPTTRRATSMAEIAGKVGSHKAELSPAFVAELADVWRETITPRFGLEDYEALLVSLG